MTAATNVPVLKDLYEQVTPYYAAYWKMIGTHLGILKGELDSIKYGNGNQPVLCCNAMLVKWLEIDPTASWHKLFVAVTKSRHATVSVSDSHSLNITNKTSAFTCCIRGAED